MDVPHCVRHKHDSRGRAIAHNAGYRARLAAEHSPLTNYRRAPWPAVQSNKVYLTLWPLPFFACIVACVR